ncbi:hypothetical protein ACFV9C_25315 [Kribbella sp. NPDC059898]|uniref:ADDT family thymidine hypermodification transferase n=1 Tax=Kribbella sp. NPDC059898 TaxID=3346995 RepID=UPI00364BF262
MRDEATLSDLATFAHLEWVSRDVEPWADLITELHRSGALDTEAALWVLYLYNAYDDFGSAWTAYARWPTPRAWATAPDRTDAADLPIMTERRNLYAGKMLLRHASYTRYVGTGTQAEWLSSALDGPDRERNWNRMLAFTRQVWGVGRQASFEWTEFISKVLDWPLDAPDGCLWESSGPRESLQRLYGNPTPTRGWLEHHAEVCRAELYAAGVELKWVDFETVICDFNVMRKGRYYVGQHLAALRAEILSAPADDRPTLEAAWNVAIPAPWSGIAPGVDKALRGAYRRTGAILDPCRDAA